MKAKRILVLAPHTDDGELGCGGTISRMLEEGHEVYYVAFSSCEASVPEGFPKDALVQEMHAATRVLGIPQHQVRLYNYPVRTFSESRQEILEILVGLRNELSPDYVFMPCTTSLHQDHQTISEEGLRAFKHYTCFGYDLPWDAVKFSSTAFFILDERHVEKKWLALCEYKTQNFRPYVDQGFIYGLARVRGAQIASKFAEAFELLRVVY